MIRRATLLIIGILLSGYFQFAQQAIAQTTYALKPTPKTVAWGYYDAKAAPVLDIKPELGGLRPVKRAIL